MAIKNTKEVIEMCFSAGASFAASGVLLIAGVATLKSTKAPHQIPFASIPLLFSVQQFCEGFVWLSLTNTTYIGCGNIATYTYLIFAQVFWPFWVPFSIYLLEKDAKRRKILFLFLIFGLLAAAYLAYCLVVYPVEAGISSHHIKYILKFPYTPVFYVGGLYILAAVIPPFISSVRYMQLLGVTILTSYLVSRLLFGEFVISVWCYFAAVSSLIIWLIIKYLHKPAQQIQANHT